MGYRGGLSWTPTVSFVSFPREIQDGLIMAIEYSWSIFFSWTPTFLFFLLFVKRKNLLRALAINSVPRYTVDLEVSCRNGLPAESSTRAEGVCELRGGATCNQELWCADSM